MIASVIAADDNARHPPRRAPADGASMTFGVSCAVGSLRLEDSDDSQMHRTDSPRPRAGDPRHLAGGVAPVLHRTGLEPHSGAGCRSRAGTRQTHRHAGVARHGVGGSAWLWALPRG